MGKTWAVLWAIQGIVALYVYMLPFKEAHWSNSIVQATLVLFMMVDLSKVYSRLGSD